ncbi:MAG: CHAD domain-containing protein, partial [Geminicoccaceae bacterium]
DWDVFLNDLLAPIILAQPDDKELRALWSRAKARRSAAYRTARKSLAGPAYNRFLLRFGAWLERKGWRHGQTEKQAALGKLPVAGFTSQLLSTQRDKVLAQAKGLAELLVEERHALRITLKKLRYALDFFAPLFDKTTTKPFVGTLKTLQDDLGHLNDVAVARKLLESVAARSGKTNLHQAAGMVVGWHARGVADLEPRLVRGWSAFAKHEPFWT